MVKFRSVLTLAAIAVVVITLTSCEREITRIETSDQPLSCAECHDSSDLITGKTTEWAESLHGSGESYVRGRSASCAGCHSGSAFTERLAAGLSPDEVEEGDPAPTRQDCRACHMIHSTYTFGDFALTSTAPVALYAVDGAIYDSGDGNLCVNCHQPRRVIPEPEGGIISGISTHWGPHHGPQSAMLMGLVGAGVEGSPSGHYQGVEDSCVHCHMGENESHLFEPEIATCRRCHVGASSFDINRVQTVVDSLGNLLGEGLLAANLINENSEDGHPTVTEAPEDQAIALWNWLYVMHEDKSMGVHNSDYAIALLEEGLARLAVPGPATP
jgi:nitrate/TMAO reductase-like tetraheme cytochrome c subunit